MSTAGRVERLPVVVPTNIKIGQPVSQGEWTTLALGMNRVLGRGNVLVPAHNPNLDAAGTRAYRVKPTYWAIARVWVVTIGFANTTSWSTANATGIVEVGGATKVSRSFGFSRTDGTASFYLVEPCAKTSSATDLTVQLTTITGTPAIASVACYELPRSEVPANASNLGIDLSSITSSQPIYTDDYRSTKGPTVASGLTALPRRGLLAWQGTTAITSGTFVDVMPLAMPVLPAKIGPADTTATCEAQVYCRIVGSPPTTGEVRLVRADGTASAASAGFTNASLGWQTLTLAFKCEDMAQPSGLPSGSWETCQLQARRSAGAGTIEVAGFTLYQV